MAEIPLQGPGGAAMPVGKTLGTAANWAGAVVSVGLLAGIGVWGYQLLVRDVSGVPVVRAIDGPMRVQPKDPGGVAADHQGLSVNEVAGQGAVQPAPDRLLLAPSDTLVTAEDEPLGAVPLPTSLGSTDTGRDPIAPPIVPLMPQTVEETAAVAPPSAPVIQPAPAPVAAAPAADQAANSTIQALADQIAAGIAPLSATGPADTPPVQTSINGTTPEAIGAITSTSQAAPSRSLRPQIRPADVRRAVAPTRDVVTQAVARAVSEDVETQNIPAGTRLVQLGAFDSADIARSEWTRLSSRFDAYMGGKTRVIQRAESGGRVFYRLRAMGFADLSDARRFCSALAAQQADCIPVVTR